MSSHDEYSSDEEDLFDSPQSDVFLGFIDIGIGEDDEYPTIEDTFIGGQPIWPHPESKPKEEDLKCDNCGSFMALLAQAYAPLDGKAYDRMIYVFGCKNTAQCSRKKGSIKAIRAINKDPAIAEKIYEEQQAEAQKALDEKLRLEDKRKFQIEMTKDLFDSTKPTGSGAKENPFTSSAAFGGDAKANPFTSSNPFGKAEPFKKDDKAEKPKTEKTEKPAKASYADASKAAKPATPAKKPVSVDLPEYPGYILFTEKEKLKRVTLEPELEKYKHLIEETTEEEGPSKGGKKERTLSSSSSSSAVNQTNQISKMLDDKFFENFTSVVNHNPTQVLRYDLDGQPVLYSGKDEVAKQVSEKTVPDPAYNPSSKRRFELQLMPKAIMDLEGEGASVADILNGMSWGTIVVYTDEEDYMPSLDENHVGYVREYCGVQWEESVDRSQQA
ncbi:hypothetical protein CA3LBN_000027 [Candidozyma haemuli]|uniref:Programmed cell death protein 2 C-terminal domain-containing protein n=1 Tax=Candidozyma haemuli TaxID=45357 RepID=A0ABX8I0H2_9ASCO|nr:hypothetical protein CA3LBN_000027 [[Candida] haemuloni]